MRILFDTNTPVPLRRFLRGHEVTLAKDVGWDRLANGALLAAAESSGFDILLTCDQNLQYQQNLSGLRVALVILSANNWNKIRPHVARIASTLDFVQRGQVVRVDLY